MISVRIRNEQIRKYLKLSPVARTLLLAVVVGILGGFGAIAFKRLIITLQHFLWNTPDMTPASLFMVPWLKRLLVPIAGGLIVGPLIYFFAREAKGHGVPEVMIAVITRNSVIRPIVVLVKSLASAICISTGGSAGREGPIVQIGAALASGIGQLFKVRATQLKVLVGCGAAAGISATFNAPIAGTLFALELIVSDFGLTSFTPIIVSSVLATAITRTFYGNVTEFTLPEFTMVSLWEFLLYLVLGVIAGIIGHAFSRSLYLAEDTFNRTRLPDWIRASIGGLCVGLVALAFPHIMGVGYDTIRVMLEGDLTWKLMLLLVLLKIVMTAVTIGSGGSGGIFAPSLFIGAMLGGAFGVGVNALFPSMTGTMGAYAIVGMAAVNSASTLAPLSAIIILVELTNNYGIILPLMFTVVMATFVSRKLSSNSIYTWKLARHGITPFEGEDINILRAINVNDVLRHDELVITENSSFEQLINLALTKPRNVIFTTDDNGLYDGVVSLIDIKHILCHPAELRKAHTISEFQKKVEPIRERQSLDTVINLFADSHLDRLPVVNARRELIGSVIMADIIRHYNQEVANRNIAIELGDRIHAQEMGPLLSIGGNTVIAEIETPEWMVGKTLGEIELRKKYGISVFIVKEKQEHARDPRIVTPASSYQFRSGDTILVGGSKKDIKTVAPEVSLE